MDGEIVDAEIIEKVVQHQIKDFNARQLMTLALIRSGIPAKEVCKQAGVTRNTYDKMYATYTENNFDALSTSMMENWECIIRSKMMNVTERALDGVLTCIDNGEMKDAKSATDVFTAVFDKFRLSTGKSTENIESTTLRLTQMIESRTGLTKPNQSEYHNNIIELNTSAPTLNEVM